MPALSSHSDNEPAPAAKPSPLFRREVAEARRVRLEGEILLTQPLRTHILVLLLAGIVLALGTWVSLGTYTRSETARGILVTDLARYRA